MLIEAVQGFQDYEHDKRWRVPGERWEVTPARFEAINSTKWGVLAKAVEEAPVAPKRKGRPTKAELLAEAEELGIEVPEGATNPQIHALIKEAR